MTHELYKKYRPVSLKQMKGQDKAKKLVKGFLKRGKVPHSILISGPTGVGKTTLARILKSHINCADIDCHELNASSDRGIETIRDIESKAGLSPVASACKMWIIDEAQGLTRDAQSSFLKILEDTQSWVYFVLCTTDPQKLLPTILSRCTHLKMDKLSDEMLKEVVADVATQEGFKLYPKVAAAICEAAEGSARTAINLLEAVSSEPEEESQLKLISKENPKVLAIELARAITKPKARWKDVAAILKGVDEDPEKLRRMILGYASAILLNGRDDPGMQCILLEFESNFYDSGMAGLVRACYEVCHRGRN